jgi:hypothetical protein
MKSHVGGPPVSRLDAVTEDYRQWLVTERSLAPKTVRHRVADARLFLSDFADRDLESLMLGDVTGFMVRHCQRLSVENAKRLASGRLPVGRTGIYDA